MIDRDYLKQRLHYDANSGVFTYLTQGAERFKSMRACNAWNARFSGEIAGSKDSRGYIQVKLDGHKHLAHRLAFLYMTGKMPKEIDHIDRVRANNAWLNLREASHIQSSGNKFSIGFYKTKSGRFRAQICVNYKITHLGTFDTEVEARSAYIKASKNALEEFSPYYENTTLAGDAAAKHRLK